MHCDLHDPGSGGHFQEKCKRVHHAAHMKLEGNPQNCRARQPPHVLSRLAFAKGSLEHLLIKDTIGFHQLMAEVLSSTGAISHSTGCDTRYQLNYQTRRPQRSFLEHKGA